MYLFHTIFIALNHSPFSIFLCYLNIYLSTSFTTTLSHCLYSSNFPLPFILITASELRPSLNLYTLTLPLNAPQPFHPSIPSYFITEVLLQINLLVSSIVRYNSIVDKLKYLWTKIIVTITKTKDNNVITSKIKLITLYILIYNLTNILTGDCDFQCLH